MEPIAIIGMACRFPGASDPAAFWRLLHDGVDAVTEVPAERWRLDDYYDPDRSAPGKMSTRWGGFLDQVDRFDAQFFRISRREAAHIDPQQRLLLEVAWEAFADAGQVAERLAGSPTGVFVGIGGDDYGRLQWGAPEIIDAYTNTGCTLSIASNRISYVFDLRGPSMSVDTACSASLVTVHLACQSIWHGDASMALAGGVNLMLTPEVTIGFNKLSAMASDGRCKAFDARADGYVRGEGAGMVVLKSLAQARADGDRIYAVIRGSALNQDGRTNGLTAPNRWAQEAVLREAYRRANVVPGHVHYVETHGTGTLLGDPIEAKALGSVLSEGRPADQPLVIGSVKTNIGHLEPAAGIASLIKVVLMLQHRELPPNLHFETPNPHIRFEKLGLRVPTAPEAWPRGEGPALAGVSAFSFGGANAHLVLEEAPSTRAEAAPAEPAYVLPMSAHTPAALLELARSYGELVRDAATEGGASLHDLCYSAGVRSTHHQYRAAITVDSPAELAAQLDALAAGDACAGLSTGSRPIGQRHRIVWVFPGQGSQWPGMGRELLATEPVFRAAVERCDAALQRYMDRSVLDLLSNPDARLDVADEIQPALFAIETGLAALWRSWGVEPDAVVGHSIGEVVAAHVAGVLSLDDAARIVGERSCLMRHVSGEGAMAVVELPIEQAQQALLQYAQRLSIGAINTPRSTVVSGDPDALQELLAALERQGIFCRRVKIDVAAHSTQMDPLCAPLLAALDGITPAAATVPIFSTVLGAFDDGLAYGAPYWVRNLRDPVLFGPAIHELRAKGYDIFLELSPHPILLPAVQQVLQHDGTQGSVLSSLRRDQAASINMRRSLGALYVSGLDPAWERLYPAGGRHVSLPLYPWQRERFWVEDEAMRRRERIEAPRPATAASGHPLLGGHVRSSVQPGVSLWELTLDTEAAPYLQDHRAHDAVLVPATAYLESVLAAAWATFGPGSHVLEQVILHEMLVLRDGERREVQLALMPDGDDGASFQIASLSTDQAPEQAIWTQHSSGVLRRDAVAGTAASPVVPEEARARCAGTMSGAEFYTAMRTFGFDYGPAFQRVERVWARPDEAIARLRPVATAEADSGRYLAHPTMLDACFQIVGAALLHGHDRVADGETYLPVGLDRLEMHMGRGEAAWGYVQMRAYTQPDIIGGDVIMLDDDARVIVAVYGVRMQRLNRGPRREASREQDSWLYSLVWEQQPLSAATAPRARGSWLIVADRGGTGEALAQLLRERGERCVILTPGTAYSRAAADHYIVQPETPDGFRQVLHDAFGPADRPCTGVAYLWSLDVPSPAIDSPAWTPAHDAGWAGALHLVQALAQAGWRDMPRLWLVTSNAQAAGMQSTVNLAQAPVWGLGRTLAYEHSNLRPTRVDLGGHSPAEAARALLAEVWTAGAEEDVALRDDGRYVARLARATLPAPGPAAPSFRADGVYVITGGLGSLGMVVAGWMRDMGARRLALVGRSRAPAAAALDALRGQDVDVAVVTADVTRMDELARALAEIRRSQGPIRGVVHAAGVIDDGTLLRLDYARFSAVMAPKAAGAWNLHALTLDDPLEDFILFSSAASLLGSPGQGNYAAANAALDALAHARRAEGRPALSINWGPWAEVGLAARPDRGARLAAQGLPSITPAQGIAMLERVYRLPQPQIAAMPLRLRQWRQFYPKSARSRLFAHLMREPEHADAPGDQGMRDAILAAPGPARQELIEAHLCREVARVVRLAPDQVSAQTHFKALGFDSLMAMELRNTLETILGLTLPATLIWTYPNVGDLAAHLATRLGPAADAGTEAPGATEAATQDADELLTLPIACSTDEWAALLAKELERIA